MFVTIWLYLIYRRPTNMGPIGVLTFVNRLIFGLVWIFVLKSDYYWATWHHSSEKGTDVFSMYISQWWESYLKPNSVTFLAFFHKMLLNERGLSLNDIQAVSLTIVEPVYHFISKSLHANTLLIPAFSCCVFFHSLPHWCVTLVVFKLWGLDLKIGIFFASKYQSTLAQYWEKPNWICLVSAK